MAARILIVDDEPLNLELFDALLRPAGYQTTRARNGREALVAFERDGADLILLDVMMPELDGIDVLTHLRAGNEGAHVPVILVTASSAREDRLRGLRAGADEFLEKPVDRAILLARVQILLRLKEARDTLARRNAELERLHQSQRELTEFLVHDLKSPITVLHANLSWAAEQLGDEQSEVAEALGDANAASLRLQAMVETLLMLARMERADFPLRRESLAVDALLRTVRDEHAREAALRKVTIELACEPGTEARADGALLRRVIENLVENALRHTPPGGMIRVEARGGGAEGLQLRVSNHGRAIPAGDRTRIFEKFARGSDARPSAASVGLGLHFCWRAMEAHGGSIQVVDDPDWPVTFAVTVPA